LFVVLLLSFYFYNYPISLFFQVAWVTSSNHCLRASLRTFGSEFISRSRT